MKARSHCFTILFVLLSTALSAQNLLNLSGWRPRSGSAPYFTQNGTSPENILEWGKGPHGERTVLWKATPDANNNADGGWTSDFVTIDHTKMYRMSVWIKKTNSNDGSTYLGTYGNGAHVLNLNGSTNNNPYFFQGDLPSLDKWYLVVGYVHGSGDNTTTSYGAIYDGETGEKVIGLTDFKLSTATTGLRHRAYLFYDTNTADRQYFHAPRMDEMNGNEPSIAEMLGVSLANANEVHFDGNVGIGTNNPGYALDVINGTGRFIGGETIGWSTDLSNAWLLVGSPTLGIGFDDNEIAFSGQDGHIGTTSNNAMRFLTGGSNVRMIITSGGNVGMGTITPTEKLEVVGNALVQGDIESSRVKVTATPGSFPDYVFKSDYSLRSISELQSFIKEHGHLPNIPKAAEVEQHGQDLGLIQQKLLEKIEELTLYTIDQDREIKAQAKQLKQMESLKEQIAKILKLMERLEQQNNPKKQ